MTPELGIIEGFYGRQWSWDARVATATFLGGRGYALYLYAPKGDTYLRRSWQEPHPPEAAKQLAALAAHCAHAGMRFGIGLSPYEIYRDFSARAKASLADKLAFIADVGARDLAILLDDMKGDEPDLADRQIEIMQWVREHSSFERLFFCPTYYSDDPVLDRIFGARPPDYLARLGEGLDPSIQVFWTGEEIASPEISPGHLQRVCEVLRRRPYLWDNYPVNDTARMSRFLNVRGFTGRPAANARLIAGHAINPALQPVLSLVPALTLVDSYRLGDDYQYGEAFRRAAGVVLGPALATTLWEDLLTVQNVGLERLTDAEVSRLRERYAAFDHDGAREVLDWLAGEYQTPADVAETQ